MVKSGKITFRLFTKSTQEAVTIGNINVDSKNFLMLKEPSPKSAQLHRSIEEFRWQASTKFKISTGPRGPVTRFITPNLFWPPN